MAEEIRYEYNKIKDDIANDKTTNVKKQERNALMKC